MFSSTSISSLDDRFPFFLPRSMSSASFSAPWTPSTTFMTSILPASIFSSLLRLDFPFS